MRKSILKYQNLISDTQLLFLAKVAFAIAWIVIFFRFVTIGTNFETYGIITKSIGFIPAALVCLELMRRALKNNDMVHAYVNCFGAFVNVVAMLGVAANLLVFNWAQQIAPHIESIGPVGFLAITTSLLILSTQRYFSYSATKNDSQDLNNLSKQRFGRDIFWLSLTEIGLIIPFMFNNRTVVTICIALSMCSNILDAIDTGVTRITSIVNCEQKYKTICLRLKFRNSVKKIIKIC